MKSAVPTEVISQSSSAALCSALLVYSNTTRTSHYEGDEGRVEYCTWHEVQIQANGRPQIMPGRPVGAKQLQALLERLSQGQTDNTTTWVTEDVLATGGGRHIWWTPPGHVPMFFNIRAGYGKLGRDFKDKAVLPVPGLVWMLMDGRLSVWATKAKAHPARDEVLYQAPMPNVWSSGAVCMGSTQVPKNGQAATTKEWERAFWTSEFTHPNFKESDRMIKGICPVVFWSRMVAKPPKRFNLNRLAPIPGGLTLADLISPNLKQKIAAIGRAQGEF